MASRPLRLLHAADFRLDRPCQPLTGLPPRLLDVVVEARYRAVERLIDSAIAESVDVVLLAGGLLDAVLTGLRGPWHLVEQFTQLQEAGIDVVWCGGSIDSPHRWPAFVGLPANVRRFTPSARTPVVIERDGTLPLVAGSQHGLFASDVRETAAKVLLVPSAGGTITQYDADYLALGGQPQHIIDPDRAAAFSGSPQGRSADEAGPHGGLLVEIAGDRLADRTTTITPIATDVLRWERVTLELDDASSFEAAVATISTAFESTQRDAEAASFEAACLQVVVSGTGLAYQRFASPSRRADLLQQLRQPALAGDSCVWVSDLLVSPSTTVAATESATLSMAATSAPSQPQSSAANGDEHCIPLSIDR